MRYLKRSAFTALSLLHRAALNPLRLQRNRKRPNRKLEIGPGDERIQGFETLNSVTGINVDYVADAARPLPFEDNTFQIIYASHVIEHLPWYVIERAIVEWVRILAPGGRLEIWTPDALKICKAFVAAEEMEDLTFFQDTSFRFNDERDPCKWASYRLISDDYGLEEPGHRNWHKALVSGPFLQRVMRRAGCVNIEPLDRSAVRGRDHGWINLGVAGTKP